MDIAHQSGELMLGYHMAPCWAPLFLLYINYIPKCIDGANLTLLADDTSVLLSDESLETLKEKVEKCLKSLNEWFTSNKLTLGTEKNFSSFITLKRKQKTPQYDYLWIKNPVIKRVDHAIYLGVFLDEYLSWEIHTTQFCNSLARYSTIYHIRNKVPVKLKNKNKNKKTVTLFICIF